PPHAGVRPRPSVPYRPSVLPSPPSRLTTVAPRVRPSDPSSMMVLLQSTVLPPATVGTPAVTSTIAAYEGCGSVVFDALLHPPSGVTIRVAGHCVIGSAGRPAPHVSRFGHTRGRVSVGLD